MQDNFNFALDNEIWEKKKQTWKTLFCEKDELLN